VKVFKSISVYKQKAKFARSIDSFANNDYQDTYQNQTNELNSNLNVNIIYNNSNYNNSSIKENFEDLKLFDNCITNNINKNLIEDCNKNTNNNITYPNKYTNNINNSINNNKTSLINNSILNNKLIEEKNFESFQIGKKLKILKNFDDIDNKIKFGYISVVPKSSLLHVNENKFLSYKEMKNEMKLKEQEMHYKLRESSLRNIQNPTPFQNFEITKNILREKIKFKKCIYSCHNTLMNNVVNAEDCVEGTFHKYFFFSN